MKPSIHFYSEIDEGFELYLVGHPALEGLRAFDKSANMKITGFGATLHKKHGWATEAQSPLSEKFGIATAPLESDCDLGIMGFGVPLPGFGAFSSHDDVECRYALHSRHQCASILKTATPPRYSNKLINALMFNPKLTLHALLEPNELLGVSLHRFCLRCRGAP